MRVVVVGGGASGFSAAKVAKATGTREVILLERTDTLGGFALVAGIGLCGAGSFAVLAEATALGGASLYNEVLLPLATHSELMMPGFDRAMLYNVTKLDARMQENLAESGIEVRLNARVEETVLSGSRVSAIVLPDGTQIEADVFVDATGSVTGVPGCNTYGRGCVECIQRCLGFGNPQGLVDSELELISSLDGNGSKGVTGTSYLLPIASLSEDLQALVRQHGFAHIQVPPHVKPDDDRGRKAGSHGMAIMSQSIIRDNILLADIGGFVKVTANAAPRFAGSLRQIPGLEDSSITQPLSGHRGHAVEGLAIAPRDNTMRIGGFDNLLCAGIKSSHSLFLLDVTVSGDFAGYNAARLAAGLEAVELPRKLASGAFIAHVNELTKTEDGLMQSPQADQKTQEALGVFREDAAEIEQIVETLGLTGIFSRPLAGEYCVSLGHGT